MRPQALSLSLAVLFLAAGLAGCLGGRDDARGDAPVVSEGGADDAVVIAVVDSAMNPYHYDFLGAYMPQHLNDDPGDDLPLGASPATWLSGFPSPDSYASFDSINLTLTPGAHDAKAIDLYNNDADAWSTMKQSNAEDVHYRWLPGTKVIGLVSFSDDDAFHPESHGGGSASVSVGNFHGTCPACLLVFVNGPSEVANEWVAKQDWIDAQTNSWGLSLVNRDRMYTESDTELQRSAIERGQSIFFSAGNGQANTFTVPNPTLFSSQEGPDWIITVGAIHPTDGTSYSGHGKPADIASVGGNYPRAGPGVSDESTFGGTSNATPVTAGLYGQALYELRKKMAGASRVQEDGTISVGDSGCNDDAATCAIGDGRLNVDELRNALFGAAQHIGPGWATYVPTTLPQPLGRPGVTYPTTDEMRFMAQGHGAFWGRMQGNETYRAEVDAITGLAAGGALSEKTAGLDDWMVADSYCRQSLWGTWTHGAYQGTLPTADSATHPMRTWLTESCPTAGNAVLDVVRAMPKSHTVVPSAG